MEAECERNHKVPGKKHLNQTVGRCPPRAPSPGALTTGPLGLDGPAVAKGQADFQLE